MLINEIVLNKIITEVIRDTMADIINNQKQDKDYTSQAKYIGTEMPLSKPNSEKMVDRKNSYFDVKRQKNMEGMEKKYLEALKPSGLRFSKGVNMLILSSGNKMKYSIPVREFITYVKKYHSYKKIQKKLIPLKKERQQLDDITYYDLIINIV